jgi:hypothetical protein
MRQDIGTYCFRVRALMARCDRKIDRRIALVKTHGRANLKPSFFNRIEHEIDSLRQVWARSFDVLARNGESY